MILYKHQKEIIDADPKKCGLFLGTGSSKTRIALELAEGNTLVICPKMQRDDQNWQRENKKWNINKSLTVMSKEEFKRDAHMLPKFDTVICDEFHTMAGVTPNIRWRNKQPIPKTSQIFEALEAYLACTAPKRLYLVTATPTRSPMSVWAAGRLLGQEWDWYKFRNTFYVHLPMPGREVWAPKTDSDTKDRLATAVRSLGFVGRLEEYFDVPDQVHRVEHVELTVEQKKRIKELITEYPDPLVRCGKVHQVENGSLAPDEFSKAEYFSNQKLEKILDYALEFPQLVIFAKYRAQIEQIATILRKSGKKILTLTGDTKERGAVILEANGSPNCALIVSAQISSGWEVPTYPCMVFASRTYSYTDFDQALGRIQRSNNIKKNIYIYLVAKGGVDESVHKTLETKKDFSERIYATRI